MEQIIGVEINPAPMAFAVQYNKEFGFRFETLPYMATLVLSGAKTYTPPCILATVDGMISQLAGTLTRIVSANRGILVIRFREYFCNLPV